MVKGKQFTTKKLITDFAWKLCYECFGIKLGNQDKPWALHVVCWACVEH